MSKTVNRKELERVCRMYNTNRDAMKALGIGDRSFNRYTKKYNIETPKERRKRRAGT